MLLLLIKFVNLYRKGNQDGEKFKKNIKQILKENGQDNDTGIICLFTFC